MRLGVRAERESYPHLASLMVRRSLRTIVVSSTYSDTEISFSKSSVGDLT